VVELDGFHRSPRRSDPGRGKSRRGPPVCIIEKI